MLIICIKITEVHDISMNKCKQHKCENGQFFAQDLYASTGDTFTHLQRVNYSFYDFKYILKSSTGTLL
jgi:hypothetical protein